MNVHVNFVLHIFFSPSKGVKKICRKLNVLRNFHYCEDHPNKLNYNFLCLYVDFLKEVCYSICTEKRCGENVSTSLVFWGCHVFVEWEYSRCIAGSRGIIDLDVQAHRSPGFAVLKKRACDGCKAESRMDS